MPPRRVRVDRMACEGNGVCEQHAPAVFRLGDDDESQVLLDEVPDDLVEQVERAIRFCPRQAIAWEDAGER